MKKPKAKRKIEERTVFILSCDGRYGLEKRPATGLLAGLWQFPNTLGWLEPEDAIRYLEEMGLKPRQLRRMVERKHIFTHIEWKMRGIYIEVSEQSEDYVWMTADKIDEKAALPTAFRQFWEEERYV